eukprot:1158906-Pelagomonas_calceolata.AAC.6
MAYLQSTEHDSAPARLTRHLLVIKGTHMSLTSGPGSYRAQLAEELSRHRLAAHTSSFFCQEDVANIVPYESL